MLNSIISSIPAETEISQPVESPNNAVGTQDNRARLGGRIPDIYGLNLVIPDIAGDSSEWINNTQYRTELFCIGRGQYQIELDINNKNMELWGDTPAHLITNFTSTIYAPNSTIPEIIVSNSVDSVDGDAIPPPNNPVAIATAQNINFIADNKFYIAANSVSEFENLVQGETLTIEGIGYSDKDYGNDNEGWNLYGDYSNQMHKQAGTHGFSIGDFVKMTGYPSGTPFVIKVGDGSTDTDIFAMNPVTGDPMNWGEYSTIGKHYYMSAVFPNNGSYTFDSLDVVEGDPSQYTVTVQENDFFLLNGGRASFGSTAERYLQAGAFYLLNPTNEIWVDIEFPNGLSDGNNPFLVDFKFTVEQVDKYGVPINGAPIIYHDDSVFEINYSSLFVTLKIKNLGGLLYRVSINRLTDTKSESDTCILSRVSGIQKIAAWPVGNKTVVKIDKAAKAGTDANSSKKYKVLCTRMLPRYEGGTMSAALYPTQKFADAFVFHLTDGALGGVSLDKIDLAGIYAEQAIADNNPNYTDGELGRFCHSFSGLKKPVGKELKSMAASVRGFIKRDGNLIGFVRDRKKDERKALFCRSNKKPIGENREEKYHSPKDHNGIKIEWTEAETNNKGFIIFPENEPPNNLKTVKAIGIKNYNQAWNFGSWLYWKMVYQRIFVDVTATGEGKLVDPGDKVYNVDGTDINAQDGQVMDFNGLIIATNESVDFSGDDLTVIFRSENNVISSPIDITARNDNEPGFILAVDAPFDLTLRGDNDAQVGTLYSIAVKGTHSQNDYIIQDMSPSGDNAVKLKMVNYADEVYVGDETTPTPQAP